MSRPCRILLLLPLLLLVPQPLVAGGVEIVFAELRRTDGQWQPSVTLRHADHPHVAEQPFTRSGSAFSLPPGTARVIVEARDTVHGWSEDRVEIDIALPSGPRWQLFDDR
jgi:hypothetical protein